MSMLESITLTAALIGSVGFVLAFLIAIPSGGSRIADSIMSGAVGCFGLSLCLGCLSALHAIWGSP